MRSTPLFLTVAVAVSASMTAAHAVEGNSAAGPIGGTDIRQAIMPPPGLYIGGVGVHATAERFNDGNGHPITFLDTLDLRKDIAGAFLIYVPPVQVFGGSIGFLGVVSGGEECGRLVASTPKRCISGPGDPYVEMAWSRHFGTVRPSQSAGAFPIFEGLSVLAGIGAVIPVGRYDAKDAIVQGLSIGNNIWDVAPTLAFTFTTPPVLAGGTEFSAKVYLNTYRTNPDTQFHTGDLLSVDFAVTERIGRLQVGLAGTYATQVEDDTVSGRAFAADGNRGSALNLGAIVAYGIHSS